MAEAAPSAVADSVARADDLRSGDIRVYDTSVSLWEGDDGGPRWTEDQRQRVFREVEGEFKSLLSRMRSRGWKVTRDPHVAKHYKAIAHLHWLGQKGDLRFFAEAGGRTAKVEFYQEISIDNPNGGRYDFDKMGRMPRRDMRLQCAVEMAAVVNKLVERGYTLPREIRPDAVLFDVLCVAEDRSRTRRKSPLDVFNERWNSPWDWKRGVHRFERDETGWPTVKEYNPYGRNVDRDGVAIVNGSTMYCRKKGRLVRGIAYTNIGEQWRLVHGAEDPRWGDYMSSHELFRCDNPDQQKRRVVPHQEQRLLKELEKATKAHNYDRVAALGRVLARLFQEKPR
jgi:hypothetical protein